MEIELADTQVPPEKRTTASGQREFAKDEAVLARFGKRQQLQVSVSPNIISTSSASFGCDSLANFAITERVWTATCHWSYQHLDDNLGGDHVVSHFRPTSRFRLKAKATYTELC